MSAARRLELTSIEDYLVREEASPNKHEYREGFVYAMAGAIVMHNRLATRLVGILYSGLAGKQCEVFNSDMKVRIDLKTGTRFYYPDASVICDSNLPDDAYQERPVAVFEVLSESTRALDEGDKKDAYLQIPSLRTYVLIEQKIPRVVVFRRSDGKFKSELYEGLDAVVPLTEIGVELSLKALYEGLDLSLAMEEDGNR